MAFTLLLSNVALAKDTRSWSSLWNEFKTAESGTTITLTQDYIDNNTINKDFLPVGDGKTITLDSTNLPIHLEVTATRTCSRDETHVESETVLATLTLDTSLTCDLSGTAHYVSTGFTNMAFTAQTSRNVTIPALGHIWGEPTYTWSDDNSTVTATRICKTDESHIETENVETTSEVTKAATSIEKGETTYTTKAFTNAAFTQQSKTIKNNNIDENAHSRSEFTYTVSDDKTSVISKRVCNNNSSHYEKY